MNQKHPRMLLAALLAAGLFGSLSAQSPSPAPGKDEILELEKFNVSGVAPEQQILPTSRPFNSVFGTDDIIVDVPRNVTIISRQQLSDINIQSVLDFSKLTSSAYTTTNFGAPANPSIRGQTADLYINGVRGRITSNGNGLPLDFNAVESVNIVKGPATAVQGASMYVGGFVDLITKRPYFDGYKGSISVTVGSYSKKGWTVDVGGPLSKTSAYRLSYSGEDSKGYWHDYYQKNNSIYGAYTYRPNTKYELFLNANLAFYKYTENWGINRVTQELIDHGRYLTGVNSNPAPDFASYPFGYADANGNPISFGNIATVGGVPAPVSDPQNSKWVTSGYPAGNRVAFGPLVNINRHARLLKPGDHSVGDEYNGQAIQTYQASPTLKIVNNTYGSYTARNTLSSYYYSEIVDPSWFAENRTEFIFTGLKGSTINAGLDLRYQRTKAYDDYFFEPANVWDLTKDLNYVNVYNSVNFPNPFTSLPVPGWPGRYATDGLSNGDTNDSHGTTVGPFVQATWKLNDRCNLVTGARYDHFSAEVREPLLASHPTADVSVWLPNYNASLVYKPTVSSSVYVTYNYSKNTSGAVGNGGGITGWNATGTGLDPELFQQPSELFEVGNKYTLKKDTLFLNFAYYDQKRTAKSTSSTIIQQFRAKGFEAELNYQPNKHIYTTLSYSYIDATTSPGFQSDGGVGYFYAASNVPGQVSGLPQNQINGLVSYSFDSGFGFSVNTLITSEINNNFAGTLVIPTQYSIDGSIWYHYKKHWDFRVNITNLTDEQNWAPPNAVYGNASIFALAGTTVELNIKYNF
jgi:outer membrane receptor protein involved in Fe transport